MPCGMVSSCAVAERGQRPSESDADGLAGPGSRMRFSWLVRIGQAEELLAGLRPADTNEESGSDSKVGLGCIREAANGQSVQRKGASEAEANSVESVDWLVVRKEAASRFGRQGVAASPAQCFEEDVCGVEVDDR